MNKLASAASVAVLLSVAGSAGAIERPQHVGGGPTADVLVIDDKSSADVGAGFGLQYEYGLNDTFNLMAEGAFAIVAANQKQDTPTSPRTRPAEVDRATVGLGYVIDIVQWVPTIFALAGVYRMSGGTIDGSLFLPGAEVGAAIDYQFNRHWSLGIALRQHFLLTKLSTYPSYTTGQLRLEYMWGY